MATLNSITAHILSPPTKPITEPRKPNSPFITLSPSSSQCFTKSNPSLNSTLSTKKRSNWVDSSVTEDRDVVVTVQEKTSNDQEEEPNGRIGRQSGEENRVPSEYDKFMGRAINAAIVLGFVTLAIIRLLTIDHEYWHGWTLYEVLRYAPEHNWIAYEEALKTNPV